MLRIPAVIALTLALALAPASVGQGPSPSDNRQPEGWQGDYLRAKAAAAARSENEELAFQILSQRERLSGRSFEPSWVERQIRALASLAKGDLERILEAEALGETFVQRPSATSPRTWCSPRSAGPADSTTAALRPDR